MVFYCKIAKGKRYVKRKRVIIVKLLQTDEKEFLDPWLAI
jgi:hypothetical protein